MVTGQIVILYTNQTNINKAENTVKIQFQERNLVFFISGELLYRCMCSSKNFQKETISYTSKQFQGANVILFTSDELMHRCIRCSSKESTKKK